MAEPELLKQLASRRTFLKVASTVALAGVSAVATVFFRRRIDDIWAERRNGISVSVSPRPVHKYNPYAVDFKLAVTDEPSPTPTLSYTPPENPDLPKDRPPGDRTYLTLQHTITLTNNGTESENNINGQIEVIMVHSDFVLDLEPVASTTTGYSDELSVAQIEPPSTINGKLYRFSLNNLPSGLSRSIKVLGSFTASSIQVTGTSSTAPFSYGVPEQGQDSL